MEPKVEFREIRKQDFESLIELYDHVWPETAGTYKRKTKWMLSNPTFHGICACDNKKIIGSRPSFQANIYYGNSKLAAVQFGLSCVHKDYRRLGIFSKMNHEFIEIFFKENKNDLIYNVSVEASKLSYQKLGWVYLNAFSKLYYFPNKFKFIVKAKFNIKSLSGTTVYEKREILSLDSFDFKLLEIREHHFRKKTNIHTFYNNIFLKWRLQADTNISLFSIDGVGAIIYKVGIKNNLRVIEIGEVFFYDFNKTFLNKMIKLLKRKYQTDLFEIVISEGHPCYSFYKKIGFVNNPFKKYVNLGIKVVSNEMKGICLNPDNWAISTLDIDTF